MAHANSSDGFTKSRSILGEITNLPTKRGFPGIENHGIKKSKLSENKILNQILDSSTQCTGINPSNKSLLKLSNENSNAKLSGFGNAGHCLIGENAAMDRSKVCDGASPRAMAGFPQPGNTFTQILDFAQKATEGDALNIIDCEACSQDFKSPDSTDFEMGRAPNSAATNSDGFKKFDLTKDNIVLTVAGELSKWRTDGSLTDPARAADVLEFANVEASDKLGDSCPVPADTSRTVSETGGDSSCGGKEFDAYESKAIHMDYHTDGDDHGADNFVMSQSGSVDLILPESQESRVFGLERCSESKKGDECTDGNDSMKACSCSFCTKAAYIWLDVNYQDIKARVSGMKKSQKEASMLVERTTRHMTIDKHAAESLTGTVVSHLECDLMHQWRSLFQRVGDLLKEESNHLEEKLQPLTDLIEKYKVDLEGPTAWSGKH